MGDVYEAQDRQLERRVAVKVYRAASPADRARFDAEVRVLAGLNHPGLVRVYDAGPHGDDAYVVLELIDGPPLSDIMTKRGALPSDEVALLGADLADALAYIHGHGVVHRDVTPSNVLCAPDGRPRLVDFGIVRLLDAPRITATATTIGTAAFMAPEQVQGLDVTPGADIYALGLMLLEAVTGKRAFTGTPHEVAAGRLVRDPDTTGVPGAWQALLLEMTARSPAERPTAEEVADRLRAMVVSVGLDTAPVPMAEAAVGPAAASAASAATTSVLAADRTDVLDAPPLEVWEPTPPPPPPPAAGRRALWAVLAGVGIAVVLALVAGATRGSSPTEAPSTTVAVQERGNEPRVTTAPPTTVAPTTTVPETIPLDTPIVEFPEGFPFDDGARGKEKKGDGAD